MKMSPAEIQHACEWILPLGVCCAEAQADGVPCQELGRDCLECGQGDPVRQLLLRLATRLAALENGPH
jgi:hypothetical protein